MKLKRRHSVSKKSCLGGAGGFTLIEAVIAMGVLAFGLMALGILQMTAIRVNSSAFNMTTGVHLGQTTLERLLALPFGHSELAAQMDPHEMVDPPSGYAIRWEVEKSPSAPDSKIVHVTVVWNNQGRARQFDLSAVKLN